jgi:hypothetical protein
MLNAMIGPLLFADRTVLDWLRYGSYVDEGRRILYVETPKCGCSSIKYLLLGNAGLHFNPLARQTRLDMMIHDREQNPLPPLTAFPAERLEQILQGDGWYRFCVIRQPAERFFSAWRDKIFLVEPGMEDYLPPDDRRFVEFADFYRRVVTSEDPATCNVHWRAQTALLLPDQIAYSRIYDIAELDQLPGQLRSHLAAQGIEAAIPELKRVNESYSIAPDGFLTPEVLDGLRQFYRADIERFAFADPKVGWAERRSAAGIANQFTDAIFDRNRLIATHSNWLQQAIAQGR